tara:strand:+ start:653 stop:853 length:201 start_codon:yes stop_codon:yes gene_type:complete
LVVAVVELLDQVLHLTQEQELVELAVVEPDQQDQEMMEQLILVVAVVAVQVPEHQYQAVVVVQESY